LLAPAPAGGAIWPRLGSLGLTQAGAPSSVSGVTPWTLVDKAESPDGTRLELLRRGPSFSIRVNGQLLMNSRVHGSEVRLAELALGALSERPRPHVLVGGLGFGYTLAAALERLPPDARVTVSEIAPAVVHWNRERLGELNGASLADPRVTIVMGDVRELLRGGAGTSAPLAAAAGAPAFDVVLLDVDNGPRAVGRESNAYLYTPDGLAGIRASLSAGGVLAIWSAGPEVGFSERLRAAGFDVVLHRVASHAARTNERHFIWLGTNA
jgi:spermidine synthase